MLPKIIQYEKTNTVRLIKNSGIQFMDFGLKLDFDSQDTDRQKYWSEHGRGCFRKTTLTPDRKSEIAEESDEGRKSFSWRRLVRDPSEPSMYQTRATSLSISTTMRRQRSRSRSGALTASGCPCRFSAR